MNDVKDESMEIRQPETLYKKFIIKRKSIHFLRNKYKIYNQTTYYNDWKIKHQDTEPLVIIGKKSKLHHFTLKFFITHFYISKLDFSGN